MNCYAGCNVAIAGGDTLSLVVGKNGCLRSPAQRETFAAELKLAVLAMEKAPAGAGKGKSSHPAPAAPVHYGQP
ncbi:MAG: hypothetical protein ABWY05_05265 [Noviherbaspirillum sp.]